MKNLSLIIFAFCSVIISSCRKDPKPVSKVVEVSAPTITLNGDKFVTLNVGQSYDDPGAVLTDDITGATSNITASESTLDINTPGLYYMSYTAANANGYVTTVARYIAVTNYQDDMDFSGVYTRTSNGVEVNFTKVSRGMYQNDDMGGAGLSDAAYFTIVDGSTIASGPQYSESIGAVIDVLGATMTVNGTTVSISYRLDAPGYGTGLRTFVRN